MQQAEHVISRLAPYCLPNQTTSRGSRCLEMQFFLLQSPALICSNILRAISVDILLQPKHFDCPCSIQVIENVNWAVYRVLDQQILINMSKQKSRRVNYRINYCSSQDPEYPVSELVLQSAESKGWITKRFAPFPQTIVIQLLQATVVQSLAFLSHQNKICTRIDIEGKLDQEDSWMRLGYTTLESGVTTNFQSRQLRNVNLGGRVLLLLKFTFHQNYSNHINIFNQIGLIALLVYGEKATVQKDMVRGKEGLVVGNLSDLDRQTILKLKNLQQLKKEAIDQYRFDDAKKLKEDIDVLQNNIKALIVLEKEKKQAIKREDYDQAKEIVERMKRLRGPMVFPRNNLQSANNNYDSNKAYEMTPKRRHLPSSSFGEYNDPEAQQRHDFYKAPSRQSQPRGKMSFDLNAASPVRNKSTTIPFDEIKIQPRDRYPVEEELHRQEAPYNLNRNKRLPPKYINHNRSFHKPIQQHQQADEMLIPKQLPSLKKLQKLTQDQFDECSKYFPIFNEVTFQYLLSKDHIYREKGIGILQDLLRQANSEDKKQSEEFVSASVFVVKKLIDDRIMAVLIQLVDFFGMMMKKFRPKQIGSANKNIRYVLQRLVDNLGHNNQKFRQECEDVFASLPSHGLTNRDLCFQILMSNPKQKMPRILSGKLNMLSRLIQKYKLSNEVDEIIDFGKKYLEDKNSQVRTAAVHLMVTLSKEMGYQNLYQDLENLKPQIIKMIEEKIEAQGGVIKKIEINRSSPKNFNRPNNSPRQAKLPSNPEYYCDFCKQFDKRFENDDFRDQHLYSSCKMITLCPECNQAIEVSTLNNHLLAQCPNHKYYKRCPKCKETIPSRQYNNHTKMKQCITAKAPAQANRCPLCHEDILPGDEGWIKHLVKEKCPLNPRQ